MLAHSSEILLGRAARGPVQWVNRQPPFESLLDQEIRKRFGRELLAVLRDLDYTVLTVVMDKLEHRQRYQIWRYDPYHYYLHAILERYIRWLERHNARGDVMAESRGGREDRRLKDSFERTCREGTDYIAKELFSRFLTSSQLKVKAKANNIAGLQMADLIAHPSYRACIARRGRSALANNFGGVIASILEESKYDRSPGGRIEGWGQATGGATRAGWVWAYAARRRG